MMLALCDQNVSVNLHDSAGLGGDPNQWPLILDINLHFVQGVYQVVS
jgi:hypothetical protein